jgi:glycosyltransferase involved in cell wall biosynthesis
MRISFIIPVRNDAAQLERCLRSIRSSAYPPDRLQILVIDNGSTDGSQSVADRLGASVVAMPNGRVAQLRNRGAQLATGDVLAFIDADNEITTGWIEGAAETLQDPNVGATGALYSAPDAGTWVQRTYGVLRGQPAGRHDVEWLGSGNLAVLRSSFEAVGGFDSSLETCEDVDLCNRLRAAGFRIVSDERLKNIHHGDPRTLRELFKGELWRGRDNLRVSLRGPFSWRAIPSVLVPVFGVLMIAVGVVGAFAAIAGRPEGLMIALAAFLAIPTLACLKVVLKTNVMRVNSFVGTLAVACVYDVARALALVMRMSHHRKTAR